MSSRQQVFPIWNYYIGCPIIQNQSNLAKLFNSPLIANLQSKIILCQAKGCASVILVYKTDKD